MTAEDFVDCCSKERGYFLQSCLNPDSNTVAAQEIASLNLDDAQKEIIHSAISHLLTDVFYSFLLALDGAASLGGKQVSYKLFNEEGNELTGELEALAWERFHGEN